MLKTLKIAHFTQFLGIGGLEKIILELSLEQMRLGHSVTVIVYDYEQGWVEYFKEQGIRVITSLSKEDGFDLSLVSKFTSLIEEEKFDIIHTHDINPLIYLSLARFSYSIKNSESFKLIHTAHTLDHVEKSKKVELFEKILSHFTTQIIAVSQKIKDFYLMQALVDPARVSLIENGISQKFSSQSDIDKYKDNLVSQFNLFADKPLALCLSRIVPLKDQLFLAEIFKDLPHLQLIIVGPPSDPIYFEQIKQVVQNAPYQNIHLLGARSDVIELNEIADFYVSASSHEGLPVSVLEAMSVGKPCLVSDIAGHRILNKYEKIVDLYERGNKADFMSKLNHLIESLHDMKYKKGRDIVKKYYSTSKMAKRYNEVYTK